MKLLLFVACLSTMLVHSTASNAAGVKFLEENAKKDGVVTLPSGLQYKVIKSSTESGALTPKVNSPCTCHYAGTLIDGTEFDSSIKRGRPSTFAPNQVCQSLAPSNASSSSKTIHRPTRSTNTTVNAKKF